ncbi:MAG: hypothetical protein FJY48_13425, partial [Betaproteobacteria bacterium]|nr:hypothetical protein [Betaproteobacteria bacterium]
MPPLPSYGQLYEQLSDAQKTLAEKDQQLAEKDQQLKQYADRIAALEGQLGKVIRKVTFSANRELSTPDPGDPPASASQPASVQPLGTEPTASAVQSSAAGQLTTTAPPPAASSSAAARPQGAAVTVQEEYEFGSEEAPPQAPAVPPPAPPPIVCFSIVTFGLKTLNLGERNHDNDVIVSALTASWPAFHADVLIDARPFHDPDQLGVGNGHTGMHREIMTRIAWHP